MRKRKLNKYQKLIRKFLKDPDAIYKNRGLISREVALGKKLYAKVEHEKFWKECYLEFKLNSLAWILSKDGIDWINREVKRIKLKLSKPVTYDILETKVGEDKQAPKPKTKTILDFLKEDA